MQDNPAKHLGELVGGPDGSAQAHDADSLRAAMSDREVSEALDDAWGLYKDKDKPNGSTIAARDNLYSMMREASKREGCRHIAAKYMREILDESYRACCEEIDPLIKRTNITIFQQRMYRAGKIGLVELVEQFQEKARKLEAMEKDARNDYSRDGTKRPEETQKP